MPGSTSAAHCLVKRCKGPAIPGSGFRVISLKKRVYRQKEPSLGVLLAPFYSPVLRRHRQSYFAPKATCKPQLFDKTWDLTAAPRIGQNCFDLARSAQVGPKNINNSTARLVNSGEIFRELDVGLLPFR